jgi:hypothetical protein
MQCRSVLSALIGFALASAAWAGGDGAIEINAASAAGGFPIILSQPGSYRLTSNLDGGGVAQPLIEVGASRVTIDLNGFALSNGMRGVYALGSDVTVRNGSIHGMTELGIWIAGSGARVEAVRASGNGFGIQLGGDGGSVLDSLAVGNGGYGIIVHSGTVRRCVVASNGSSGIDVTSTTTPTSLLVTESVSTATSGHGIGAVDASLVGNLIVGNTGGGVRIFSGQLGATGLARNVFSNNSGGPSWGAGGIATGPNVCGGVAC